MHLIGVIGFVAFGLLAITLAIVHEFTWWRRRGWSRGRGVIVGHKEHWNDGVYYNPEIQFDGPNGVSRFVSKYGSNKKPHLGRTVDIVVDESGESAEHICVSNRFLPTFVPVVFGLIFIIVGLHIKPISQDEQDGGGNSAALRASP